MGVPIVADTVWFDDLQMGDLLIIEGEDGKHIALSLFGKNVCSAYIIESRRKVVQLIGCMPTGVKEYRIARHNDVSIGRVHKGGVLVAIDLSPDIETPKLLLLPVADFELCRDGELIRASKQIEAEPKEVGSTVDSALPADIPQLTDELATMPIGEFMAGVDYQTVDDRRRDVHLLLEDGRDSVGKLLNCTIADISYIPLPKNILDALAEHDLELFPPNGAPRLPAGVPKTVTELLSDYELSVSDEIKCGRDWQGTERPRNCLLRAEIFSTSQLIQKGSDDLLGITNFGEKSLDTVWAALRQHHLGLVTRSKD